jgi:uncharacterized membrane protein YfcA
MRALLASPLGFLIGLSLGALGGGGSILAVPALVYVAGQDPKSATTTSLVLVGAASLVGAHRHWRAGRVQLGTATVVGLAGVGGSLVGSAINRGLDPDLLLLGFAGLVAVAAWRMVVGCPTCTRTGEERAIDAPDGGGGTTTLTRSRMAVDARTVVTIVLAGTAVGFLTGLFGVGGGFVIVPVLTLGLKLPMPKAIGTSLVVIVINSVVALSDRLATTSIDWAVTIPFSVAAIAGVLTGSKIADRLDAKRSLRWFAVLLVMVSAYTALRAVGALLG